MVRQRPSIQIERHFEPNPDRQLAALQYLATHAPTHPNEALAPTAASVVVHTYPAVEKGAQRRD